MPRVLTLSFVQTIFVNLGLLFLADPIYIPFVFRQGCPIAPLVYILQAEPVACAIRGDSEIQGIKLHGGKDGEYIETKLCMFADDTQLFNKNR
jgi:hypothetical protein